MSSSNSNIFMKGGAEDAYSSISTPSGFADLKSKMGKDVQLNQMFGGKRRKASKKGSKKKSRKTSKKGSKRKSRKGSKRKSKSSRKKSRKSTNGKRRRKSKSSRSKRKKSKSSRKKSKRSKKQSGGRRRKRSKASKKTSRKKSRKGSKKRSQRRELPPALVAFRKFVAVVAADPDLGLSGVVDPSKLAGIYKKLAEAKNPSLDNIAIYDKAKEIFSSDSLENKKKYLAQGRREMAEKKAAKAAKKAAALAVSSVGGYSATSDY
jgi:hypothetical protein